MTIKNRRRNIKIEPRYVQLPALPMDMPAELIEMLWIYIRLPEQEQKMIRDFIREDLKDSDRNLDETKLAKVMQEPETEINPDVKKYTELMKKLLGTLIAQSCDMVALVYQNYCIEEKSIEEISKAFNVDEESVQLMALYYDKKIKSEL